MKQSSVISKHTSEKTAKISADQIQVLDNPVKIHKTIEVPQCLVL